ncbi:MAG: hypothetical protein H7843_11960 [Nitrospirota bacterium]
MEDTCWIKDERGRFQGRRPGCKMEKSGVTKMSDNKSSAAAPVKDSTGDNSVSYSYTDEEKRLLDILNKPESQRTAEEKAFVEKYLRAQGTALGMRWTADILSSILALISVPQSAAAISLALASGIGMDVLMKYAEANFGKLGPIGVILAAVILAAKGKLDARAAAKAEQKAAAAIAERKAAEAAAAEKRAAEEAVSKKAAAAEAEKKAAEEAAEVSAQAKEKIGKFYDETANYKYDPNPAVEAQKKANTVSTGDVKADEANAVNAAAKVKGYSVDISGYKTETSQYQIEHSMTGHSDVKTVISQEKQANGVTVRNKYKIPEEQRVVEGGKHNVSLTKNDYQNIDEYRDQAVRSGSVVYQPAKNGKNFESVKYLVPQKDGVIHMVYRIDPVSQKMIFVTMWKVGYK